MKFSHSPDARSLSIVEAAGSSITSQMSKEALKCPFLWGQGTWAPSLTAAQLRVSLTWRISHVQARTQFPFLLDTQLDHISQTPLQWSGTTWLVLANEMWGRSDVHKCPGLAYLEEKPLQCNPPCLSLLHTWNCKGGTPRPQRGSETWEKRSLASMSPLGGEQRSVLPTHLL